jgi:hypothetical protein
MPAAKVQANAMRERSLRMMCLQKSEPDEKTILAEPVLLGSTIQRHGRPLRAQAIRHIV